MKTRHIVFLALTLAIGARADSTISSNTSSNSAYGANIGWLNWRGDGTHGAVIGEYVCSGFIYSANVGWINLGSGSPANGIQYQNNSATDFGVNHDGQGNLRGYAYGANIGWINFESNGAAKVDLSSGKLSGSIYSANCGWISLSNAFAVVKTDFIAPGADDDHDGITDAWELSYAKSTSVFTATSDSDGDGQSDLEEYLADTDPLDSTSNLRITFFQRFFDGAQEESELHWTSRPTRQYRFQYRVAFGPETPWIDPGFLSDPPPLGLDGILYLNGFPNDQCFFRMQAVKPLSP